MYPKLHNRTNKELLLMLNLPFKLHYNGVEIMTGDHTISGEHYASAAYVAAEDINR